MDLKCYVLSRLRNLNSGLINDFQESLNFNLCVHRAESFSLGPELNLWEQILKIRPALKFKQAWIIKQWFEFQKMWKIKIQWKVFVWGWSKRTMINWGQLLKTSVSSRVQIIVSVSPFTWIFKSILWKRLGKKTKMIASKSWKIINWKCWTRKSKKYNLRRVTIMGDISPLAACSWRGSSSLIWRSIYSTNIRK